MLNSLAIGYSIDEGPSFHTQRESALSSQTLLPSLVILWLTFRFSIVVIPVYMDEADRESSPYGNEDWYVERLSWKWMNTIMRVNSLVMKVSCIMT